MSNAPIIVAGVAIGVAAGVALGASRKRRTSLKEKVDQIMSLKAEWPDNIAVQCFDKSYYDSLPTDELKARFLKCLDSGRENPDSGMGCYANQPGDYETFEPFFRAALERYHKVDLSKKKHVNDWSLVPVTVIYSTKTTNPTNTNKHSIKPIPSHSLAPKSPIPTPQNGVAGLPANGQLDFSKLGLSALSLRVRSGRNLKKFPLPGAMTRQDRVNMEAAMQPVFDKLIADTEKYGGKYVSMTPGHANFIDESAYQELVRQHIMFKDMSADSYVPSQILCCTCDCCLCFSIAVSAHFTQINIDT
jgi:hypothetical protein